MKSPVPYLQVNFKTLRTINRNSASIHVMVAYNRSTLLLRITGNSQAMEMVKRSVVARGLWGGKEGGMNRWAVKPFYMIL